MQRKLWLLIALALALGIPTTAHTAAGRATVVELLPSAARTADVTVEYVNQFQGYCQAYFVVEVTADPAAASVVLRIRLLKLDGVTAITAGAGVLLVSAAIDAVGTTTHVLGNATGAGTLGMTTAEASPLPSHWQLQMDHADTDSITYSVTGYFFPQCF